MQAATKGYTDSEGHWHRPGDDAVNAWSRDRQSEMAADLFFGQLRTIGQIDDHIRKTGDWDPALRYGGALGATAAIGKAMELAPAEEPRGALAPGNPRGFEPYGFNPPPGTRMVPEGIPETWRIRPTQGEGGVWYYDPTNKGNAVRVMPGDPSSPFPNSQAPYVRWQKNGQPLDVNGNVLSTKYSPDAHIPLKDFRFNPELFK